MSDEWGSVQAQVGDPGVAPPLPSAAPRVGRLARFGHVVIALGILAPIVAGLLWVNADSLNPDGISYIQVARRLARFDLAGAVNGYWSPLMSWLLVPVIWLGGDPLRAIRIGHAILVLIVVGGVGIAMAARTCRPTAWSRATQVLLLVALGCTIAPLALRLVTPDFLSGVALVAALLMVDRYVDRPTPRLSVVLGGLLAGVYFAKSAGFLVSGLVLAYLLARMLRRQRNERGTGSAVRRWLPVAVVFGVCVLPWIVAISAKYGRLTISTTGSYAWDLFGPTRPPHPIAVPGAVVATSGDDAVWAWDDPSGFRLPTWSVREAPGYAVAHTLDNLGVATNLLTRLSPLVVLALVVLLLTWRRTSHHVLLAATVLMLAGYAVVLVEERYLYLVTVPIVVLALVHRGVVAWTRRPAALLVAVFLVVASLAGLRGDVLKSGSERYEASGQRWLAERAGLVLPDHATVAGPVDRWQFCYFSETRCLGFFVLDGTPAARATMIQAMRAAGITYYIERKPARDLGLPVIYTARSPEKQCRDLSRGTSSSCSEVLTVYGLGEPGHS